MARLRSPQDLFENHATNAKLAAAVRKYVEPMLERARRNRRATDTKARRRYNQWALITDEKFYQGRANAYIPAVRRGTERFVTQCVRETFPTDEWWSIEATDEEFEPNVVGAKLLIDTQLKRRIKIKRKARPYYRQLGIYGTSILKYWWRTEERVEPVLDQATGVYQKRKRVTYDDPDVKVVDYFSFGVWPETVADVDDAALVYEDEVLSLDELKRDKDNYARLDELKASAGAGTSGSEALQQRQERLRRLGITEDELNDGNYVFLTNCYITFDLKDGYGPGPVLCVLGWDDVVTRLQRNVYGRPPYRVGKDAEMPDEFLAHARTEATDRLQIILNDAMNQDLDASSFANMPVVVIDPNYCEDYQSIALYPSAKIPAPPDAVKFDRPPDAAYGQKEKIAFIHSLIAENLGSPASSSPSPAASGQPRGARTFGGMQLQQMLAGSEVKELVEFQEDTVWEPLLQDIAWLNAHFMPDERTLQTAGRKGAALVVNRETFKGDYAYDWLGTATVQSQTVRSAQMLVAMNILRGVQPGPQGYPDFGYIFKEWWTAQGFKHADRVWITPGRMQPIDPEIENQLCAVGRAIEVSPADPDADHIVSHARFRATLPPESPEAQKIFAHEQAHYHSFLMKQQAQAMQAMAPGTRTGPGAGPTPRGARAGVKATQKPPTGMGPVRAVMDAPAMTGGA